MPPRLASHKRHDRADLLATEDDIVTRLAGTLQVQLADIEEAKLERTHPANAEAQEFALRRQAAHLNLTTLDNSEAAFRLCDQALAIDPNSADAHYPKAGSLQVEKKFEEAKVEYERAIELNPCQMNAYSGPALANLYTGRPEEVIAITEKAVPESARFPAQFLVYHGGSGQYYLGPRRSRGRLAASSDSQPHRDGSAGLGGRGAGPHRP